VIQEEIVKWSFAMWMLRSFNHYRMLQDKLTILKAAGREMIVNMPVGNVPRNTPFELRQHIPAWYQRHRFTVSPVRNTAMQINCFRHPYEKRTMFFSQVSWSASRWFLELLCVGEVLLFNARPALGARGLTARRGIVFWWSSSLIPEPPSTVT
jgi:hypothetical protein